MRFVSGRPSRAGPLRWWAPRALLIAGMAAMLWAAVEVPRARAGTGILARVGPLRVDADALLLRAARLAPSQLLQLGSSWPEQRRQLLEGELIREALLDLEAARDARRLSSPRDQALARALLAELRDDAAFSEIRRARIESYHAAHRREYESPRALLLWRILLRSESDAREVLRALATPNDSVWSSIARERSIDLATNMRSGSLGYVAADGQTHMPQVRVSPELFAAADRVADGQIVPDPVRERQFVAVVWRRASRPAVVRPVPEVEEEIRAALLEQTFAEAVEALRAGLRQRELRDHQPALLSGYTPRPSDALEPMPERATPLPVPRKVTLSPRPTDLGWR